LKEVLFQVFISNKDHFGEAAIFYMIFMKAMSWLLEGVIPHQLISLLLFSTIAFFIL